MLIRKSLGILSEVHHIYVNYRACSTESISNPKLDLYSLIEFACLVIGMLYVSFGQMLTDWCF